MSYTDEELSAIYDKTDGRCHLCKKKLAFSNYFKPGRRGAWEVDHSNPKAAGGSNRWNNLLPACIPCNRSKQDGSTRAFRTAHGFTRRPMSSAERRQARTKRAVVGGFSGTVIGARVGGPVGAVIGGVLGTVLGKSLESDD